jgi:hypothetical protein
LRRYPERNAIGHIPKSQEQRLTGVSIAAASRFDQMFRRDVDGLLSHGIPEKTRKICQILFAQILQKSAFTMNNRMARIVK